MATYVVLNATTPQITFTLADPYMIFGCITVCLGWLHTVYSMKEAWDFSSHSKDKNKKSTEKNGGGVCLDCGKIPGHYGIKSQPSNTELDQIDHLSRSARGACRRRTRIVSQGKTPACNAVQYRAQSAAISTHWRARLFSRATKKKKASAKRASIWNARTVLLKCRSNKDEWGEEISSCRWMQII